MCISKECETLSYNIGDWAEIQTENPPRFCFISGVMRKDLQLRMPSSEIKVIVPRLLSPFAMIM